jgi:hypothetical protein
MRLITTKRGLQRVRLWLVWAFACCWIVLLSTGFEAVLIGALISTAISTGLQILSNLLQPKPPTVERGKRQPLQQDSQYGNQIPRIYGRVRLAGEIIWTSGIREQRTVTPGRGKGSKRKAPDQVQYSYYASWAVRFCINTKPESPIGWRRIWFDTKLVDGPGEGTTAPPDASEIDESGGTGNTAPVTTSPAYLRYDQFTWYGGTANQNPDPTIEADKGAGKVPGYRRHVYCVFRDILLDEFGARIPNVTVELEDGTTALAEIVERELLLAGLAADEINVQALAGNTVDGLIVPGRQAARETIETLARAYFFDLVEVDGQLRAVRRGGLPVLSIPYYDIGVAEGEENAQAQARLTAVEAQRLEIPRGVTVSYLDASLDYETGTAVYNRQSYTSNVENLPVDLTALVLTQERANQIARTLAVLAWTEKRSVGPFTLPPSYIRLTPADVVTIADADGVTMDIRITRMELSAGGKLAVTGVRQLPSAYRQRAVNAGSQQTATTQTEAIARLRHWFASGFTLSDVDALSAGFYVAVARAADAPTTSRWRGAVVFRNEARTDEEEARYEPLVSTYNEATLGTSVNALGTGSEVDVVNTLDVLLDAGTLESITQNVFDNSAVVNIAVLGREVIQFRDAVQPDAEMKPQLWRLSTLRRGVRGTATETGLHVEGEAFVLVNEAVRRVPLNNDQVNVEFHYKVATFGEELDDVDFFPFTA